MTRRTGLVAVAFLHLAALPAADQFRPDPASVRRHDAGYRYPQNGWAVLHIEGEPYERGYQHGKLLAKEIEAYVAALSEHRAAKHPAEYWSLYRDMVGAMYLKRFDREYLEEMKGIAEGASAGGAKAHGRAIDLTDIAGVNLWVELATLGDALRATPTGVEDVKAAKPSPAYPPPAQEHHCSAFAATGPATADGKLVFGHITMWNLHQAAHFFVWLDVKPAKGHRVVLQTFPGGIYSGMDYYLSSSGLMLTETTIDQTRFHPDGRPLATRARHALQYADTIDGLVKELVDGNNGLYTNEWLIGDANTNEIAVLEQGTHTHRLRRSSKNEWLLPGTDGFYWGCNNGKDLQVRLETMPGTAGRPEDVAWRPDDRDLGWLRLYKRHRGKIDPDFGKLAYSAAPLAKLHSLDAKVTTATLAKELKSHALQGPPYGRVWPTTPGTAYQIYRPLVPNDWTVIDPKVTPGMAGPVAADLGGKSAPPPSAAPPTVPAWHGTLLPKADADVWLTAGFAALERLVARENAFRAGANGRLAGPDRQAIDLELFRHRTGYLAAKANRPGEKLSPLDAEMDRGRRHRERVGYGVLTLHALRQFVGAEPFAKAMDAFGTANAGKEVTVQQFTAAFGESTGKDVARWLADWGTEPKVGGPTFSTDHWLTEPGAVLVVAGTAGDVAANREAAAALQTTLRLQHGNVVVPVKADVDVTDADLKGRHVALVGRPATNTLTKRFADTFPVTFGDASVTVGGELYAHEGTAVVAAGTNPLDGRFSLVVLAGLSADATFRLCERPSVPAAEVVVYPNGGKPRRVVVTKPDVLNSVRAAGR
jgi:hypothetical protein